MFKVTASHGTVAREWFIEECNDSEFRLNVGAFRYNTWPPVTVISFCPSVCLSVHIQGLYSLILTVKHLFRLDRKNACSEFCLPFIYFCLFIVNYFENLSLYACAQFTGILIPV